MHHMLISPTRRSALVLLIVATAYAGCDSELRGRGFDAGAPRDDFGAFDLTGFDTGQTCATQSSTVKLTPLDMILALDNSRSMDWDQKWNSVRKAIKAFVADPAFTGLGVGVQYFPLGRVGGVLCGNVPYAAPAVPVAQLPGVAEAVGLSLDERGLFGGTPMLPLMEGVLDYASQWAEANRDRKVVIVLATDGVPDGPTTCGIENTIENVVQLAGNGLSATPSIVTFVIGVGSELSALNQISRAGGSGDSLLINVDSDVEAALFNALTEVRRRALPCEFDVPSPSQGTINFDKVNVQFKFASNTAELFVNVEDVDACGTTRNTWYYDVPAAPTKIVFCPETCAKVQASVGAEINTVFGCRIIVQ